MAIEVYTDGACRGNPGPGSWGVVIIQPGKNNISFGQYNSRTTNNQMELTAILQALHYIDHHNIREDVIVYSDSAYCVNSINLWMDGWVKRNWANVKNLELMKPMYILKTKLNNVKYIHVKGHNGNHGNELVDKLCNDILDNKGPIS